MTIGLWVSLAGAGCLTLAAAGGVVPTPLMLVGFFLVCCAKGSIGNSYSLAVSAARSRRVSRSRRWAPCGSSPLAGRLPSWGATGGSAVVPVALATGVAGVAALSAPR